MKINAKSIITILVAIGAIVVLGYVAYLIYQYVMMHLVGQTMLTVQKACATAPHDRAF
jgi:hypothetical protein